MGTHTTPPVRAPPCCNAMPPRLKPFPFFLLILLLHVVPSSCASDPEILLKFKKSITNNDALASWNDSVAPCSENKANWVGVLCSKHGNIWGMQIEDKGLKGIIDIESLRELPHLRTLSFMNNNFTGSLPDIKKIGKLKSVFLSNNQFSGEIPAEAFEGMLSLKKLHLAQNQFTGNIPSSLTSLPKLMELELEGNKFQGKIPDFQQKTFKLNLSNNKLEGSIPASLSKLDASSFQGNKGICGEPLDPCKSPPPSPPQNLPQNPPSDQSNKPSVWIIITVAIAALLTLMAIGAVIFILNRRRKSSSDQSTEAPDGAPSNLRKKVAPKELDRINDDASSTHSRQNRKGDNIKLSFVRDDRERFDLQDLLRASAEVLGSGCFGSSYKTALSSGQMMVVKRFKQLNNVDKEEFQEHMRRLGRLRHPNVLPLVAYYYRKEEKLLVSDYVENGSLAVRLHGHQSLGLPSLDWPTRLKIVKGLAKGLVYLSNELPSIITPHGHLKSSNILLDESMEPLLTDYGLIPVVNQEHAQEVMVAYKSPEYLHHGRITKKTDTWSFGIFILEILTGKFPANFVQQGKMIEDDSDLASMVNTLVREERTSEAFDKEMEATTNSEGEMLKLLKIGLECCEGEVEKRLELKEAVERIEELRESDNQEFYSTISDGQV